MPTINDYMTDSKRGMQNQSGNISLPDWIIRAKWPDSWKIMMSQEWLLIFLHGMHEAAAVITFLSPGLRFIHQGQFKGRKKRISPHLVRGPEERENEELEIFYKKLIMLLKNPVFRSGEWQQLDCSPAWEGNWSNDCFISFAWNGHDEKVVVAVNYSSDRSQCYINLPFHDLDNKTWLFQDMLSDISYERDGNALHDQGLYLDEPVWKTYVFSLDLMKK